MEGKFEKSDLGVPIPGSFREQWGQTERLILSGVKQGDRKKACADLWLLHDKMIAEDRVGGDETLGSLSSALNVYERQLVNKLKDLNEQKPGLLDRTKLEKETVEVDKLRRICHNAALVMNGVTNIPVLAKKSTAKVAATQGAEFQHSSCVDNPTNADILDFIAKRVKYYKECAAQKDSSEERSQAGPMEDMNGTLQEDSDTPEQVLPSGGRDPPKERGVTSEQLSSILDTLTTRQADMTQEELDIIMDKHEEKERQDGQEYEEQGRRFRQRQETQTGGERDDDRAYTETHGQIREKKGSVSEPESQGESRKGGGESDRAEKLTETQRKNGMEA